MDNIQTKTTEHGVYQYDYDDLHRLTSVDNPVVPSLDDESFTYDSVGNRLTSADTTETWSYNQNNELQSYDNVSYVYDDNGNMTQKTDNGVVTNYIYNVENRLEEVRDGSDSLIASYYYDPLGQRLWKDVGGTKTYFHYADEGLIGEYDSNEVENKVYGYLPNSKWTTNLLLMKENGNYYFYQNDHLGTPQKMTGVNGAVVWSASYTSFGEASVEASSSIINNLRFPGQYYDEETGLHYNYFRYYDSGRGRYLNADPVGFNGGDVNHYIYANNDPVNFIDPLGLFFLVGMRPCDPAFAATECPASCDAKGMYYRKGAPCNVYTFLEYLWEGNRYWYVWACDCEECPSGVCPDDTPKQSSPSKMQKEVEKGNAPNDVDRINKGHVPGQEDHIHYKDGSSSNKSGGIHDKHKGTPKPGKKTNKWLEKHGWKPFKNN